jgi:hypothetical protein
MARKVKRTKKKNMTKAESLSVLMLSATTGAVNADLRGRGCGAHKLKTRENRAIRRQECKNVARNLTSWV